MYVVRLS